MVERRVAGTTVHERAQSLLRACSLLSEGRGGGHRHRATWLRGHIYTQVRSKGGAKQSTLYDAEGSGRGERGGGVLISGHDKKGTFGFAKKHRTSRRGTRAHRRAQRTYARTSDHTVRHPRSVGWEVNMCHLETRGEEAVSYTHLTLPTIE